MRREEGLLARGFRRDGRGEVLLREDLIQLVDRAVHGIEHGNIAVKPRHRAVDLRLLRDGDAQFFLQGEVLKEGFLGAVEQHLAVKQADHAVDDARRPFEVVVHDEHGRAVRAELVQYALHHLLAVRVEGAHRFVHDEDVRLHRQYGRNAHRLPLPAGQCRDRALAQVLEV